MLFGALVGGILYQFNPNQGIAFIFGSLVMTVNIVELGFIGWVILTKKMIALGLLTVVTKYAFLGLSIYYLVNLLKVDTMWLGMGVASIVGSALLFSIYYVFNERKIDASL